MVLEELKESDSVALHNLLDLDHQGVVFLLSIEVGKPVSVGGLGASGISIDHILEAVRVVEEVSIPNLVVFVSVNKSDSVHGLLAHVEAESVEDLSKDLGTDLEGAERISVLEERFGIETVLSDHLTELLDNVLNAVALILSSLTTSVDSVGANLADSNVNVLLKSLGGKDLIDFVRELSPLDVFTLLGGLEDLAEKLELRLRDLALSHGETNAELSCSDVTGAESVKVAEELRDANSLLLGEQTNACDHVVNIVRVVPHDLSLALASLGLREVVGAVVESLIDTEELCRAIDVLTKVDIIDLIDVTLVHVSAENPVDNGVRSRDSELVQRSQELVFCHMAVLRDVEVLEDWLQVNAVVLNSSTVLFKNVVNFMIVIDACKVLATSEKGVILSDWSNARSGSLVNALDCEGCVDVCDEVNVAEEALWVTSLVLLGQCLELVVCQVKVHGGENRLELVASHTSLSQLVEVSEELFNSDAFHDYECLDALLDVRRVV